MLNLYLLFPAEYGLALSKEDMTKALFANIENAYTEKYGQDANVIGWKVLEGSVPDDLNPELMMNLIKGMAEQGIDPFFGERQSVRYSMGEFPPGTKVGVCLFSDQEFRTKRRRFWRR